MKRSLSLVLALSLIVALFTVMPASATVENYWNDPGFETGVDASAGPVKNVAHPDGLGVWGNENAVIVQGGGDYIDALEGNQMLYLPLLQSADIK